MKKILIVNDGFPPVSWGGANTITLLHAQELRRRGYDVCVFTTTQDVQAVVGWGVFDEIPVRVFYTSYHPRWWAWRSLYNPQILGEFARELRVFAPNIVHFHNIHNYFSYKTIATAKKSGAKIFLTAHDVMSFAYQKLHHFIDYSSTAIPTSFNYHVPWQINMRDARLRFNPFRNTVIRHYLRKANTIFAVSEALKQALTNNGIRGNVSIVRNGIDMTQFQQSFDEVVFREKLGLSCVKVVLFVGRFTGDKGCEVIIKAFARVAQLVAKTRLLVVGYDQKRCPELMIERLIDAFNVRDKIICIGSSLYSEMHRYYQIADCVVVPSVIFDSFPNVNLEAMAAGKPVIATCFGGSREAVVDGISGYIVNPLNINMLARQIVSLLEYPSQARAMGHAGYARAQKQFIVSRMVDAYCERY